MSSEQLKLLRECYKVLEEIQHDGWCVHGGKSEEIPQLLMRIRLSVYSPIHYTEIQGVAFRCLQCDTLIRVNKTDDIGLWAYVTCIQCEKQYRVVWRNDADNLKTYILSVDEESKE